MRICKTVTFLLVLSLLAPHGYAQKDIYLVFKHQASPFYYSKPVFNDAIGYCFQSNDSLFCFISFRDSVSEYATDGKLIRRYVHRYYINRKNYKLSFRLEHIPGGISDASPEVIVVNNTYYIYCFRNKKKKKNYYYHIGGCNI